MQAIRIESNIHTMQGHPLQLHSAKQKIRKECKGMNYSQEEWSEIFSK